MFALVIVHVDRSNIIVLRLGDQGEEPAVHGFDISNEDSFRITYLSLSLVNKC